MHDTTQHPSTASKLMGTVDKWSKHRFRTIPGKVALVLHNNKKANDQFHLRNERQITTSNSSSARPLSKCWMLSGRANKADSLVSWMTKSCLDSTTAGDVDVEYRSTLTSRDRNKTFYMVVINIFIIKLLIYFIIY